MGFNRFNIGIVILCMLIAIIGIALVEVWSNVDYKVAKITVSLVWVILIIVLIKYVNRTNRRLKQFLENIKYSDYLNTDISNSSFKELNFSLNEILRYVRLADLEKESTHQYLRQILDQMPTGIITTTESGKVEIINRAGQDILETNSLELLSQLNKVKEGLEYKLLNLKEGTKEVISINTSKGIKSLLFQIKNVKINQRNIKIISFENIRTELDIEEEKAWRKIFRVLTHEIMNSIGPIRSLTSSVLKIFALDDRIKKVSQLKEEDIEFAVTGLKSIDNRNQGLSSFVADFKKVMRIPEPNVEKANINEFIDETLPILKEYCTSKNIRLEYKRLTKSEFILIDKEQITQVLINLVKNSSEAINTEKGEIKLKAETQNNSLNLSITDNGQGISLDHQSEIFIPFFTTKKEGSGIGLSVSRQIIRNHHGELNISSQENKGTTCKITFPVI